MHQICYPVTPPFPAGKFSNPKPEALQMMRDVTVFRSLWKTLSVERSQCFYKLAFLWEISSLKEWWLFGLTWSYRWNLLQMNYWNLANCWQHLPMPKAVIWPRPGLQLPPTSLEQPRPQPICSQKPACQWSDDKAGSKSVMVPSPEIPTVHGKAHRSHFHSPSLVDSCPS